MSSALNPAGEGPGAAGLHVETIRVGPDDYRGAHRLVVRGLRRSPLARRHFRRDFLYLLCWTGAAVLVTILYHIAEDISAGRSFAGGLGWALGYLPVFVAVATGMAALFTIPKYAFIAWWLRRVGRKREAEVPEGYELTLAWNGERFGVVVDGMLLAWPIPTLLAWDETEEHLFVVGPDAEVLFPIPRAAVEAAPLAPLRDALIAAEVPGLGAYAERELQRRLEPPPPDAVLPG